jgi:hypothetical protein
MTGLGAALSEFDDLEQLVRGRDWVHAKMLRLRLWHM